MDLNTHTGSGSLKNAGHDELVCLVSAGLMISLFTRPDSLIDFGAI